MKPTSLFNISGGIVKIDNVQIYSNIGSERTEQNDGEDSDDADSMAVAEARPEQASDISITQPFLKKKVVTLSFIDCIAERETAHILRQWLHQMMDPISSKNPKEKLIYLRAVSEAKVFSQKLSYKAYVGEFGKIASTSYYEWMYRTLKYRRDDIDALVEQYYHFLAKYSE